MRCCTYNTCNNIRCEQMAGGSLLPLHDVPTTLQDSGLIEPSHATGLGHSLPFLFWQPGSRKYTASYQHLRGALDPADAPALIVDTLVYVQVALWPGIRRTRFIPPYFCPPTSFLSRFACNYRNITCVMFNGLP